MVNYKYKCVACAFYGYRPHVRELNRNFPKTKTFERYHKGEKLKQNKDVQFPHSEISQNGIFSAKRR